MPETLTAQLTTVSLLYSSDEAQTGDWETRAVDDVIQTVLEHHGIPYEEQGLHAAFLSMAPYLFLEQVL